MNEEYQEFIENEDNAGNNEDNNNDDNNIDNNNNEVDIDMEVENENQYDEYEYNQNNEKVGDKFYNDYDLSKIEVNKTQPSYSSEIQSSEISENNSSVLIYDGNEY